MGKSVALAASALVVCVAAVAVLAAGVEVEQRVSAEMYAAAEMEHYARLWTAAKSEHVAVSKAGVQSWRCCRPCASNTVPILHEAFEQDKDDMPTMKSAPPPPGEKKLFLEVGAASASASASASEAEGKGRGRGRGYSRRESEFQIAQRRKAIAQADALAGRRVDSTAYSCCNQCPDLMYPFPGTWNRPSPYSYKPPSRFQLSIKKADPFAAQRVSLAETASLARAATAASSEAEASAEAAAEAEAEAEAEADSASDRYVPTNPHHLPKYYYWETVEKAAPPRTPAARDGKWDKPLRPGASPEWHPPPPPHDDIFRMSRSPNLHDGSDLKTPPFLPPCCDYCMSTYFPHIINDEWQLPKRVPYTIGPFSKAFVQVDEHITADATADAKQRVLTKAATKAKSKGKAKSLGPNDSAISSAEAAAKLLPSAKSDPKKCCHKCVRKDIEDTDWQVYALPPPKKKIPPPPPQHRR